MEGREREGGFNWSFSSCSDNGSGSSGVGRRSSDGGLVPVGVDVTEIEEIAIGWSGTGSSCVVK